MKRTSLMPTKEDEAYAKGFEEACLIYATLERGEIERKVRAFDWLVVNGLYPKKYSENNYQWCRFDPDKEDPLEAVEAAMKAERPTVREGQ